jgi:hypothetical protein
MVDLKLAQEGYDRWLLTEFQDFDDFTDGEIDAVFEAARLYLESQRKTDVADGMPEELGQLVHLCEHYMPDITKIRNNGVIIFINCAEDLMEYCKRVKPRSDLCQRTQDVHTPADENNDKGVVIPTGILQQVADALDWARCLIRFHTEPHNCVCIEDEQRDGKEIICGLIEALALLQKYLPTNKEGTTT